MLFPRDRLSCNSLIYFYSVKFTESLQFDWHRAKRCRRISASRKIQWHKRSIPSEARNNTPAYQSHLKLSIICYRTPKMWINNLVFTLLESASSVIELQLTFVIFEGVPQFESMAQNESTQRSEYKFLYLCYFSQLRRWCWSADLRNIFSPRLVPKPIYSAP